MEREDIKPVAAHRIGTCGGLNCVSVCVSDGQVSLYNNQYLE